jgi:hypothetical protein
VVAEEGQGLLGEEPRQERRKEDTALPTVIDVVHTLPTVINVVHIATTVSQHQSAATRREVCTLDITGAYLNADMTNDVYVRLPAKIASVLCALRLASLTQTTKKSSTESYTFMHLPLSVSHWNAQKISHTSIAMSMPLTASQLTDAARLECRLSSVRDL